MIGPGIKKYAQQKGLKITEDVAYGYIDGYLVTLIDGWDIKKASFACDLTEEAIDFLDLIVSEKTFSKKYKLEGYEIGNDGVTLIFYDTIGTMKRLIDCVEAFIEILKQNAIPMDGICPFCDKAFEPEDETKIVLNDEFVHKAHGDCADELEQFTTVELIVRDKEDVVKGVLGAFLGSIIGTLPWVVSYYFGWSFPLFGILVGICAKYGYDIAKGRVGKEKLISVFSLSVVGSAFGMFFSYVASFLAHAGDAHISATEILQVFVYSMTSLNSLGVSYIIDFVIASLLAFVGAYIFLKSTHEEDKKKVFRAKILEDKQENKNEF